MGRAFVRSIHASGLVAQGRQILGQTIDDLLLGKDHLAEFIHVAFQMGVADF